ncbi:MAG: PAS domain S-box protein, partial [Comamonadaceae bacterium]
MMAATMALGASTLFDHLPIGAWRSDTEGGRLHANAALQRLLGLPDEAAVHAACAGRPGGWQDDPARHAEFLRLLAAGDVAGFVSTLRRADTGETLTVREHAWTVRTADGRVLRHEGTVEDITSQRQAEVALQLTLDNAGRGIIRLDAQGRVVLHNRRVLELLDLPEHVMAPGADAASVLQFQDARGDFGPGHELVAGHARADGQESGSLLRELATRPHYLRRTRDGRVLEVTRQALDDGGVVRTYSDVTDYVQAQEALREKTHALQITLDSMDQGIVAMDASGRTIMHNRRYRELLDLPEALLATLPTMAELTRFQADRGDFGPDFGSVDPAAREAVRGNQPLLQGPETYQRKTLDGRTLEVHTRPLPGGGAVRTFSDVSARMQAQEALAHKQAQLAALVNNLPDRVWLKDLDGVYLLSNPAQCKFVGLPEHEVLGRTSHDLFGTEVGDRQAAVDARAMAATQPLVHEEAVTGPTPGTVRHMEVVKVGMRDDEGRCIGVLGIARDITVRKQAEAALIHARDVAQAGERAKAEFLANMSHEIRTPLNAVIGLGELLATTPLTATQQTYAQAIRSSGAALLQLINDILDFSKAEAGRLELEHVPLHLRACLDGAVQMVRAVEAGAQMQR